MSETLKAAANAAGLNAAQKQQIDALSKALTVHQSLMALPQEQAQKQFQSYSPDQQKTLVGMFGEDQTPEAKRSILGNAMHYAGVAFGNTVGKVFQGIQYASDLTTRAYRTGALATSQNMDIAKAWSTAGRNGEKLFIEGRIEDAVRKYGADRMAIAQRVSAGESLSSIAAKPGNEAQAQIAALAAQGRDNLFQDALDAANAAKYSPGRQLANLVLPASMEGSGIMYKLISGLTDAAYRTVFDPTLAAGKLYRMYNVAKYSLDAMVLDKAITGGKRIDEVFSQKPVQDLWNQAGQLMKTMRESKESGDLAMAAQARAGLKRLVPELPDAAWDKLSKKEFGINNAKQMRDFLKNSDDGLKILSGQAVRLQPLLPALTPGRKVRIAALTTGNKVRDWSQMSDTKVLDTLFGETEIAANGVREQVGQLVAGSTKKALASTRFSQEMVKYKVDRFIARFQQMPMFDREGFDVMSDTAGKKIYQFARLQLPHYQSQWISEYFDNAEEGVRKEIFNALWDSMANVKHVTKTTTGQWIIDMTRTAPSRAAYASPTTKIVDDAGVVIKDTFDPSLYADGSRHGVLPSQMSSRTAVPDLKELSNLAARDGVLGKIAGLSNHDAFRQIVNYWNYFTLAGPRFAMRNAIEDYMVHLAVGKSAWGIPKARMISTQLRVAREGVDTGWVNRLALYDKRKDYAGLREALRKSDISPEARFDAERRLMAMSVYESKVGKALSKDEWEIMHDQLTHGDIDNLLATVTDGATNGFAGYDDMAHATRLRDAVNGLSVTQATVNGKAYQRQFSKGFKAISPAGSVEDRLSYLDNIVSAGSDPAAGIAIAHLENRAEAVNKIKKVLEDPAIIGRYRSAGIKDFSIDDQAERIYAYTWNLFSKQDGKLNRELLAKFRPEGYGTMKFKSSTFGVDDLPTDIKDMPAMITGKTYYAIGDGGEGGGWLKNFVDKSWWNMGQANARFSREPIALDAVLQVRKQWKKSGFEDGLIKAATKGLTGDAREGAELAVRKHLAELAQDRAVSYTLAYVDNPMVQSQLAFVGKNMARYYRATEDFYRRFARALRYNPDAIAKAALTYEGITHSGFVETDDQGEKYFVFPGVSVVYRAVQGIMGLWGSNQSFKMPMPLDFKAKISMITPSLNPDSLSPTFAGPVAAVPLKIFTHIVGRLDPTLGADLTKLTLGQYAVDQPMVNAILPAHINRIYAALNRDDQDSQYASAARKAMTYAAAAGWVPKPKIVDGVEVPPSAGEIKDFQEKLKNATLAILGTRAILGFIAPASPQVDLKSDMANWVRDNGEQSFKTAFNQLVNKTGDYNKAMEIWLAKYPNQMPFTVSESSSNVQGLMRSIKPVGDWLDKYSDVAKRYPNAASFLVPQTGPMSFDVYRTLSNEGFITRKDTKTFYQDITTAGDLKVYYANRDSYQQQLAGAYDDFSKQQIKASWDAWKTPWLAARPDVQAELAQGGQRDVARNKALTDLRSLIADKTVKASPKAQAAIKQMIELYDQYKAQQGLSNSMPGLGDYASLAKTGLKQQMEAIAAKNANASAAYDRIFRGLIGD